MHPIFMDEISRLMVEDIARRQHAAIALQSRRTARSSRRRVRSAVGHSLVRMGIALAKDPLQGQRSLMPVDAAARR